MSDLFSRGSGRWFIFGLSSLGLCVDLASLYLASLSDDDKEIPEVQTPDETQSIQGNEDIRDWAESIKH